MKQIRDLAYYELRHIFKDPILFLLVFIVPSIYAILFGLVYMSAILDDMPVAIVNLDNSQLSRQVITAFENDKYFKVVDGINSYEELEQAMKTGVVRAGVLVPEDFEKMVSKHQHTELLVVYDGSNLTWGYNIRKNAMQVVNKFTLENTAAYLAGMGLTEYEIANTMNTIDCNITAWYNTNYNYIHFIFLGIMMMVLHQIGLLSAGLIVTREKEKRTWVQFLASPMPAWKIALSKCLPYLITNFFNYSLLLWISSYLFQVKVGGNIALIIITGLLFDICITFAGFLISVYSSSSLQVTRYVMLLSVPLFMCSGYVWPFIYVPSVLEGIFKLLPYTWMAHGIRAISIKNLGIAYLWPNILVMALMASIIVYFAFNFKKERKMPDSHGLEVNVDSFPIRK